jgi:hypothetical protein
MARFLIIPPELGDGASKSLIRPDELAGTDIFNAAEEWLDGATAGEELAIGWTEKSPEELEELEERSS